jgi:hypothetical protein
MAIPAGNWRRMHRGWGAEPKRSHRTWLGAWWHQRSNHRHFKVDADITWIYPCWFTDANTFGRKHYHIGHIPGSRKLFDPSRPRPRSGTLFLGVFVVEDGYEVRTFETRPPTCHPPQPTVTQALRGYVGGG